MNIPKAASLGIALAAILLVQACVEDTPALFIIHNSALDESCEPILRGNPIAFQSVGAMDITVATTYVMFPKVENLMSPSGAVSLGRTTSGGGGTAGGGGGGGTSRPGSLYEGNRVTLNSATVSFRPPSGFDVAMPRNLRIPISGTLEPNGDVVTGLTVINNALGQQLRSSAQLQDRGSQVPVEVELRFSGVSTSGRDVESNLFTYPLTICRGCLLAFPPESNDPLEPSPNCRKELDEDSSIVGEVCLAGQDSALDCRVCRVIVASEGGSPSDVEESCEPVPRT